MKEAHLREERKAFEAHQAELAAARARALGLNRDLVAREQDAHKRILALIQHAGVDEALSRGHAQDPNIRRLTSRPIRLPLERGGQPVYARVSVDYPLRARMIEVSRGFRYPRRGLDARFKAAEVPSRLSVAYFDKPPIVVPLGSTALGKGRHARRRHVAAHEDSVYATPIPLDQREGPYRLETVGGLTKHWEAARCDAAGDTDLMTGLVLKGDPPRPEAAKKPGTKPALTPDQEAYLNAIGDIERLRSSLDLLENPIHLPAVTPPPSPGTPAP